MNSPKATVSFLPKESWYVPLVSLSFGQAFFTEDPRIGTGTLRGHAGSHVAFLSAGRQQDHSQDRCATSLWATSPAARNWQKSILIPGCSLTKGPSRLRFMTVAVRQNFSHGSLLATFSKADARDLDSGEPTPEAPRTIFDLLGTIQKLPFRLQARGEFEYVGAKPLGTGCLPEPGRANAPELQ